MKCVDLVCSMMESKREHEGSRTIVDLADVCISDKSSIDTRWAKLVR